MVLLPQHFIVILGKLTSLRISVVISQNQQEDPVEAMGTNINSFSQRLSHCWDICKDWLAVLPLFSSVTTDLLLVLLSWVLLPAGLAVPVIVMLTVNVTEALGMRKHSDLKCIKSRPLTVKPEISNVWLLLFLWTSDTLSSKIFNFVSLVSLCMDDKRSVLSQFCTVVLMVKASKYSTGWFLICQWKATKLCFQVNWNIKPVIVDSRRHQNRGLKCWDLAE